MTVIKPMTVTESATIIRKAYAENAEFKKACIASVLSVLDEMKGSYSDEAVAIAICERVFGDK